MGIQLLSGLIKLCTGVKIKGCDKWFSCCEPQNDRSLWRIILEIIRTCEAIITAVMYRAQDGSAS